MTPTGYVRKYAYDPGGVRVLSFYAWVRQWLIGGWTGIWIGIWVRTWIRAWIRMRIRIWI